MPTIRQASAGCGRLHAGSGKGQAAALPLGSVAPLRFIADQLRENAAIRHIAAELERSPSTISREIRRKRHPVSGQYRPHAAQARADARRPRP
ncbi:helix-turn-helix domain-containing protein [Rhodococcus sp. ACT016]|uniref:helix-turn-helix domain-containing protein n=1 Tax=Rhodococcus sp. ACT016 TaxID=3134808 RepID=UPI003D2BDCD5